MEKAIVDITAIKRMYSTAVCPSSDFNSFFTSLFYLELAVFGTGGIIYRALNP